jgi:type VI secretion system protein ImpL
VLVWFAGPYVAFGDYRPLENYIVRQIVILLLVAGIASLGGFKLWRRTKSCQLLAKAVSSEDSKDQDDSAVLQDTMKDALTTLIKKPIWAWVVIVGVVTICFALGGSIVISYVRNRALIDHTDAAIADYRAAAGPLATETIVADRDLAKVLPLLYKLRLMPTGYAQRSVAVPLLATFGLNQRDRLQSLSESAYHVALERLFRSRLLYRLEEVLEANRNNPSVIYEALKVYLMLGGLQRADRELILGWMRRDWADNLYPGAANAEGRKALEEHFVAMLDLDTGSTPTIELHGPLVQESQKTLARLSPLQRAYELLRSQVRASVIAPDWVPARSAGPDFALVFQPTAGDLDSVRVPGFYTYAGFHRAFVERLGGIAEQIKQERWVLGAAGEQQAVTAQYDRLGQDLLDLYSRDFVAVWRQTLGRLQFKPLTADRPQYIALSALGAATSPLKQLLESIRDETALTRERPGFGKPSAGGSAGTAKASETTPALLRQQGLAPGATIEAAFKPFHIMVEGDASRRPIDAIVANLNEINQSLTTLATNPALQVPAIAQLQQQVAGLRLNAARLPPPFADMLLKAAGAFEADLLPPSASPRTR